MHSSINFFGAAALFAGAVNSHMIMAQPKPFGTPDNSPLSASGSDFPCKSGQVAGYQGTAQKMQVGQSYPLTFTGTAVHGGGSCQLSLTKDTAPTKSSSFKVIHSYLGACPGVDGGASQFSFSVPPEVPAGKYTFAWTWFNNIGNREMYMNCAPVEVAGGSGSDSTFNSLPDMAVYNLADINGCKTKETTDVNFPNPGKYVTKAAKFTPSDPQGSGCGTGASSGSSGASGASGSSGSGAASGSSGSPTSGSSGSFGEGASGSSATQSANNGQYTGVGAGSGAAGAAPTATSLLTVYTTQTGGASIATAAAGSGASGSSGSSSGSSSSGSSGSAGSSAGTGTAASCSPDGSMICSADGSSFGLCNFGKAVMMPVAAGTKCSAGQIMRRTDFRS